MAAVRADEKEGQVPAKAATEKEPVKQAEPRIDPQSLHVMAFSVLDGSALVVLSDESGKKLVPLRFAADENGYKLISASVQAETKELKVVASLEGKEHTFTQSLGAMPKVPVADGPRGFGASTASVAPSGGGFRRPPENKGATTTDNAPAGRSSRGPSEEDRKKYESLSEAQKDKFRDALRELFSKEDFRNASEDERRDTVRKLFERIQKQGTEPSIPK